MIPGDPACYRGTDVLVNRYDVRDPDLLKAMEYKFAVARELELAVKPLDNRFDFDSLKAIHRHVFQDTYDWAGETRDLDFAKRNKATGMVNRYTQLTDMPRKIEEFNQFIAKNNQLKDLKKPEFIRLFAEVQIRLNELHPFREGNGRSTRIFMASLARDAGYEFDISLVDADKWNLASHLSLAQHDPKNPDIVKLGSSALMREVLSDATRPTIDHAFVHESKHVVIQTYPDTKPYFDRLDSIAEKAAKLGPQGGDASKSFVSSAVNHIQGKLKQERQVEQNKDAMERLAQVRPEMRDPNASVYGPTDNHKIVEDVVKQVFTEKGYTPQVVAESLQKTTTQIEKIAAMRASMKNASAQQEDRQFERFRG